MPKQYEDLLLKEVKDLLEKLPPNVRIRVYYDGMGKNKYTLNGLGSRVDQMDERMNRFESKLDRIGDALFEFIEATNKNFKRVNERLDNVEKRLDYNGLKKLPEVH